MEPQTLLALAVMITNAGVTDISVIDAQLNAPERQQMHQMIDSGASLPEALENVLVETQARIDRGEIPVEIADGSHPTAVC